jgi:PBP1b-binding outer membrane lipoprotein LpoB
MRPILILSLLLAGCSTVLQPKEVIIKNNEKDTYITKVEEIVSEAGSALTAVAPTIPAGVSRELVEGQIVRLSGVSKPSVERVESFRTMVKSNDLKAVKKDKEEASKVDAETNHLWAIVEQRDGELAIAQAIADQAEKEKQREIKNKILWMCSCIGGAIFTAGVLVLAFTPRKAAGVVLMLCGSGAIGSSWIFDSPWFPWIAGAGVGFALLDLLILGTIKLRQYLLSKTRSE